MEEQPNKPERSQMGGPSITAARLAQHIKEHLNLSWEDACTFIIRLTLADLDIQRQLKEEYKKDSKIPSALQLIIACTEELGWGFAIPEDKDLNGFIIGNPEYIDKVLKKEVKTETIEESDLASIGIKSVAWIVENTASPQLVITYLDESVGMETLVGDLARERFAFLEYKLGKKFSRP